MANDNDKPAPPQRRAIERSLGEKDRRLTNPPPAKPTKARRGTRQTRWDEDDESDAFEKFGRRSTTFTGPSGVADLPIATVLEARGSDCIVAIDGETWTAKLAPRLALTGDSAQVVVGDHVRTRPLTEDTLRIEAVEPRRSVLGRFVGQGARRTSFDPIAANVDLVLMVCTPQSPPFRAGLIDRYYTAAALEGLPMAICLNKVDLGVPADVETMLEGYESLGVQVFRLSAATGDGLHELEATLEGKITLFTGHSGVGKSTLLNAIQPGLSLATGSVTGAGAGMGKGRHTTSSARLIPLSLENAYVVDSPGIRDFGLGPIDAADLIAGFPDIADAAQRCSVRHCRHQGEPDCAVALELPATPFGEHRLASYRSLAR